jgi:hypothetical protein
MSTFSTTVNNNINPYLKYDQKSLIKKTLKSSQTESNCISNFQNLQVKNIYNNLDYSNVKGLKKFNNFHIFSIREKRLAKKKMKLNLRMKKNLSVNRKHNHALNSQSSIYLTQNLSEGNFSILPKILEKLEITNIKKSKRNINNVRNTFRNINDFKESISEKKQDPPIKIMFLNRLKNNIERKNETEKKMNSANNYLFDKKLNDLNLYKKPENYYITYIEKLNEFLKKKKVHDLRRERLLQYEELAKNKIEAVKEQINSMHSSQRLLENKFLIKYQEYLASLYKEKDKQDNKDIILCTIIYGLRRDIKELDKKVKKLLFEKNTYIKWLLLQIQVKNKLLKLPKEYQPYLKLDNTKNLPKELQIYIKNIIFPNPEDLINRIDYYENRNIKSLEIYHRITNETYPLKDELEKVMFALSRISNIDEINKLNEIKLKLKSKNQILINQINYLKKEGNIFPTKNLQKRIHSKLYEKIKLMRNNIIYRKIKEEENINENVEILKMLKELEIEIDLLKNKHQFYLLKYSDKLKMAIEKREKEKRIEKIRKNKKIVEERQIQLKKSIIEKANKQFILPNMKINWTVYNIKKVQKKIINENNHKEIRKSNEYEYLFYQ